MTDIPANPQLSPQFDKARRLSRILAVVLTICFWLLLAYLICVSVIALWPEGFTYALSLIRDVTPSTINIPAWGRAGILGLLLAVFVPLLLVFHYARRIFQQFTIGEVFSPTTIGYMRTSALWLIISGVVPPRPALLIVGIATYVATYVMAEARRIADDNAGIV